jgi:hypothetical protein
VKTVEGDENLRRGEWIIRDSRAAELNQGVLVMVVIALAGHIVMAGLLPPLARPLPAFSALLLLGAALAICVVTRRPHS